MPPRMPRINLPPLTRAVVLVVLLLSALNATIRTRKWTASLEETPATQLATHASNYLNNPQLAVPYLVLVPLKSLRYPWTTVTAAFVENNIISLSISLAVIWFGGRYLERAWGSKEFGKFILFVTWIPNVVSFFLYGLWHSLVGTPEYPTPIQGLVALEAGFLVALKQLVPEHTVSILKGAIRVRIKHFPALFTLANIISGPLLGTDTALWLSLVGFLTSWVYLRFFRITDITSVATDGEGATMRGDASDTFAFVAFFPDVIHPFLSPVCDGIYATLVRLSICVPFSDEAIEAGNENAASRPDTLPSILNNREGVSGARRAEAERRRALALKALDQRLNAAAANRTSHAAPTGTSNAAPASSGDLPETSSHEAGRAEDSVKEAQT
ncbi:hypothetical protein M433DRAFT_138541 [Acidomyces richmondensis BFW]|nr:MAG: hypothetical protein FE78DRAFT_32615 [Acidomyces sp. 'richmondensis']KYG40748.1 hypothetical protein M433DRAFT_138541 [Acidomyces richmondensis BFW]